MRSVNPTVGEKPGDLQWLPCRRETVLRLRGKKGVERKEKPSSSFHRQDASKEKKPHCSPHREASGKEGVMTEEKEARLPIAEKKHKKRVRGQRSKSPFPKKNCEEKTAARNTDKRKPPLTPDDMVRGEELRTEQKRGRRRPE